MRRDSRNQKSSINNNIMTYSIIGGGILLVVLIGALIYSKSLSDNVKQGTLKLGEMANSISNNTLVNENTESASTEMGKTVEESKEELENTTNSSVENNAASNSIGTTNSTTVNKSNAITNTNKTPNTTVNTNAKAQTQAKEKETKKELSFIMPVDGEKSKEYARDNLLYSETLKEWTTHLGIDIKAEKTTVVKAAESGTVKSIKNDPRYGLTIVIDHGDGYQSVYANLLTSEFVVEGENVEKGQSIGTVGNTAVFEIADEPHLHFEILKDSVQVDPNLYIK